MRKIIDFIVYFIGGSIAVILSIGAIEGFLGIGDSDSDKSSSDKVENFQGEYVLTSYSEDPSSPGWRFIVKPDKTVKMKLLNENGEEYDSPWLPGYWEEYSTILEGRTIYVITIGDDEFYLNLKDNYATMSEYDMKSKVPLLKIKKVK